MNNSWKPYKNNILIKPLSKDKIIGDTSKYYLYGEVLDVGSEVKDIQIGSLIGYTLWGIKEILEADGTKHFFLKDDSAFILATKDK